MCICISTCCQACFSRFFEINSINPLNGQILKSYQTHTSKEVSIIIDQTQEAWKKWRISSHSVRSTHLIAAAEILRSRKEELAILMALEMGKPLKGGRAEIEKCADVCEFYAQNAELFLQDELIQTDASKSYVSFQPLGVILAVMPWNFPFWQVFRFLAPALMAGNTAVLKHASNVFGCALEIEKIIKNEGKRARGHPANGGYFEGVDLKIGGEDLPTGTYFYILETGTEEYGVIKGYVYIQR